VIHSPHAGRSSQLAQSLSLLEQAGIHIAQVIPIAELDALPAQGADWQAQGVDLAVAAGGDGLVGGVIAHIVQSGLPLGILPLGTANDIARSLHIPMELSQAIDMIAHGAVQAIDIGTAQPAEQAPHVTTSTKERPVISHVPRQKHGFFAHVLTVGLNVQFARLATNVAIRQRFGRMTYPLSAFEVLRSHEALDVELHFAGLVQPKPHSFLQRPSLPDTTKTIGNTELLPLRCRALQVTVINTPLFGGAWQLTVPDASIDDGLLDIVVIEDVALGQLSAKIAQFFNLPRTEVAHPLAKEEDQSVYYLADLTGIPGLHHLQARGVHIKTNADPRDVTLDGEVRGQTPMFVCLAPQRLRVVAPR
jgi:diacylglycerol kinase (ATP)